MTFPNPAYTYKKAKKAGKICFLKRYKAPKRQTSLNQYRFQSFTRSVENMKNMQLNSIPGAPTTKCSSGSGMSCPPKNGGGHLGVNYNGRYSKVFLKTIFCHCKRDCIIDKCGWRKEMLTCSAACLHC